MEQARAVNVKVFRYDPTVDKEPRYETYQVPVVEGTSVQNALTYVSEHYDGSLAYYFSCRIGCCNGCVVKVNGKNVLACNQLIEGDLLLEPSSRKKLIKDLLIDQSVDDRSILDGDDGSPENEQ